MTDDLTKDITADVMPNYVGAIHGRPYAEPWIIEDRETGGVMMLLTFDQFNDDEILRTAQLISAALRAYCTANRGLRYWGLYWIAVRRDGAVINGRLATRKELQHHLAFRKRLCEPIRVTGRQRKSPETIQAEANRARSAKQMGRPKPR